MLTNMRRFNCKLRIPFCLKDAEFSQGTHIYSLSLPRPPKKDKNKVWKLVYSTVDSRALNFFKC